MRTVCALAVGAWAAAAVATAVEVPLRSGWNLIALPEAPLAPSPAAVTASVADRLLAVWTYRTGRWLCYSPGQPDLSDLEVMSAREGYWIQVRADGVLRYVGNGVVPSIPLQAGWNLVSANGAVSLPPGTALSGVAATVDEAWGTDGQWRVYRPAGGTQGAAGALSTMTTGQGYWVHVSASAVWDSLASSIQAPVVPPGVVREEVTREVAAAEAVAIGLSDGTAVSVGALTTAATVTLSRETEGLTGLADGYASSGSLRVLSIDSDALPSHDVVPRIVIPRAEIGTINPSFVCVARLGDVFDEQDVVSDSLLTLPAHVDAAGNLVAHDIFFADSVEAAAQVMRRGGRGRPLTTVRYVPLDYQGSINMTRPSVLVRMVPKAKAKEKRQRLIEYPAHRQRAEDRKPIQNVVVFVHGHNESEGRGHPGALAARYIAPAPWLVDYKRDVWTLMYEEFLRQDDDGKPVYGDLAACTRFYEFIYPSWQSIFETLGPQLATALGTEFKTQLKAGNDLDFNLFVIAHSMGGLVSRAGVMLFDEGLDKRFQKLTTWGSPHRGASMYSLAALAGAEPSYEWQYRMNSAWNAARSAIAGVAADTPGMRDLRWDNHRPLVFPDWFVLGPGQLGDNGLSILFDLENGPWLYSENIKLLNQCDRYANGRGWPNRLNMPKYGFMFGITTKQLGDYALNPPDATSYALYAAALTARVPGLIAIDSLRRLNLLNTGKGATINRWLIRDPAAPYAQWTVADSDGAVPVTSMAGEGLTVQTRHLGDTDHEEYYGAPLVYGDNGECELLAEGKGKETAQATYDLTELREPIYACPTVAVTEPPAGARPAPLFTSNPRIAVAGRLKWPGDPLPGKRAKGVEQKAPHVRARLLRRAPPEVPYYPQNPPRDPEGWLQDGRDWYFRHLPTPISDLKLTPDGEFSGNVDVPPGEADLVAGLQIVFTFKDNTELAGAVFFDGIDFPASGESADAGLTWTVTGLDRVLRHTAAGTAHKYYADYPEAGEPITVLVTVKPRPHMVGQDLRVRLQFFTTPMHDLFSGKVTETHVASGIVLTETMSFPGCRVEWVHLSDEDPGGFWPGDAIHLQTNVGVGFYISPAYRPREAQIGGTPLPEEDAR